MTILWGKQRKPTPVHLSKIGNWMEGSGRRQKMKGKVTEPPTRAAQDVWAVRPAHQPLRLGCQRNGFLVCGYAAVGWNPRETAPLLDSLEPHVPLYHACPGLSLDYDVPLPLSGGTKVISQRETGVQPQPPGSRRSLWRGDGRQLTRAWVTGVPTKRAKEGWCRTQRLATMGSPQDPSWKSPRGELE